jgi:hypothetical protein
MSSCRSLISDLLTYRYCPDTPPPRADRTQALLQAHCVDELTGLPIAATLRVSTTVPNVDARAGVQAMVGLVANPLRRFPGLRNNGIDLDLRIECRRYLPLQLRGTLGPINTGNGFPADFPAFFAPIAIGAAALHRDATRISGRCMAVQGGTRQPLANVSLSFSGIWHRFPAATEDPMTLVEAPNLLALAQGLYAARADGVAQAQGCVLAPQGGEEKTLLATAAAGSTRVRLADRINLAVGTVLALQHDDPERAEYLAITAIEGASTDDQPAVITLAHPLRREHRIGAVAVRALVQNLSATGNNLTRAGIGGDQTLFLDGLVDLDQPMALISGGAANEYHRVARYLATSDSEGYFQLPPLGRVAMLRLGGSEPGPLADVEVLFSPDYEREGSRVDLVFS